MEERLDVSVVIAPNGRPDYEAAHIVTMLALGHDVDVVTMDQGEARRLTHVPGRPPVAGYGGACAAVKPKRPWSEWPAHDVAVGAVAGIVWTAFFPSGGYAPEGDPSAAL